MGLGSGGHYFCNRCGSVALCLPGKWTEAATGLRRTEKLPLEWGQGFGFGGRGWGVLSHSIWTEIRVSNKEEAAGESTCVCTRALTCLGVKLGEKESEHTLPFTCLPISNSAHSSRGGEWRVATAACPWQLLCLSLHLSPIWPLAPPLPPSWVPQPHSFSTPLPIPLIALGPPYPPLLWDLCPLFSGVPGFLCPRLRGALAECWVERPG